MNRLCDVINEPFADMTKVKKLTQPADIRRQMDPRWKTG
jgi:hypothetical protein